MSLLDPELGRRTNRKFGREEKSDGGVRGGRIRLAALVCLSLLLVASLSLSWLPHARGVAPWDAVTFYGDTVEVAAHDVGTGTVTCPGGAGGALAEVFYLTANQTGTAVTGSWTMSTPGAADSDQGEMVSGEITSTGFNVTATFTHEFGGSRSFVCDAPIPATVTFTGDCGRSSTVTFFATNGIKGTVPGAAFCSSSGNSSTSPLRISTEDQNGDSIDGYYAVLYQGGSAVATGFSPVSFDLTKGETYVLLMDDYGSCHFQSWEAGGPNPRTVSSADAGLEAVYHCGSSTVSVTATHSDGSPLPGYYATLSFSGVQINTCFTPCSFALTNDQYYDVTVANYGGETFDHWGDSGGTTYTWGGLHTVTIPSGGPATSLTAVYTP